MNLSDSAAAKNVPGSLDEKGDEVMRVCIGFDEPWKAGACFIPIESGSIMYAVCDAHMTEGFVGTGRANVVADMVGIDKIL